MTKFARLTSCRPTNCPGSPRMCRQQSVFSPYTQFPALGTRFFFTSSDWFIALIMFVVIGQMWLSRRLPTISEDDLNSSKIAEVTQIWPEVFRKFSNVIGRSAHFFDSLPKITDDNAMSLPWHSSMEIYFIFYTQNIWLFDNWAKRNNSTFCLFRVWMVKSI